MSPRRAQVVSWSRLTLPKKGFIEAIIRGRDRLSSTTPACPPPRRATIGARGARCARRRHRAIEASWMTAIVAEWGTPRSPLVRDRRARRGSPVLHAAVRRPAFAAPTPAVLTGSLGFERRPTTNIARRPTAKCPLRGPGRGAYKPVPYPTIVSIGTEDSGPT